MPSIATGRASAKKGAGALWAPSAWVALSVLCLVYAIVNQAILFSQPDSLHALDVRSSVSAIQTRLPVGVVAAAPVSAVYLPFIAGRSLFYDDPAIWSSLITPTASPHYPLIDEASTSLRASVETPGAWQVTLFRHRFQLDETLDQAELVIFADTRYQAWLDGKWIGRGPARFSMSYREYDVLPLGALTTGEHVLAVLVQWAPNTRRSESGYPMLRAHVQGSGASGVRLLARTGPDWLTLETNAWQPQAAPVHSWSLVGPTELLDLQQLPDNWYAPDFNDLGWSQAVITSNSEAGTTYEPRSIPPLIEQPVTPVIAGVGLLSPGYLLGEFLPSTVSQTIPLTTTSNLTLTLEILKETLPPTVTLAVDGATPDWQPAGAAQRPDVSTASLPLAAGTHHISLANVPALGMALAIQQSPDLEVKLPFQQGLHAGHRLLLADYQPNPTAVETVQDAALSLSFVSLPGYAILDLGRTIHGRIAAQVSGPPGSILDIGWDERLSANGIPLPYPGSLHPQWNQVDSWVLDGLPRQITTLDARAGRYLLIAAWGKGPIQLQQITITEERYPTVQSGSFHSSDSRLNTIWQTGVETMRPNMTDAFTDTPWRERGQWWGDAYIGILANQAAFGDTLLWRRGIRLMADAMQNLDAPGIAPNPNDTHMLDYAMLWVDSLANYIRTSGDLSEAYRAFPQVVSFMQHLQELENVSTGLLDLPQMHWSQTAYIDPLGYDSRYGQSTALNALYTQALRSAAEIARSTRNAQSADQWELKAEALRQAVNQWLYLPDEGRYLSTIYQGTPVAPGPHAQAYALTYGLPEASQQDAVAQSLLELLSPDPANPNLNIYGFFWVLEGLARSGYISQALGLLDLYYGRLLDQGATTWWEQFAAGGNWRASLSHAWGVSPTWFLSSYVLGATQTGANTWQVKLPFDAGETYSGPLSVEGAIPLRNGPLEVSWERNCPRVTLQIASPAGTHGEIILPRAQPGAVIWLNGAVLPQDESILADEVPSSSLDEQGRLHLQAPPSPVLVEIEPGC